ncbi:hypothetical protein SAMN04488020_101426 [Palleronia marisminoris]|uniref:Topology modulation protein n=1 Tax=Palleronia marisminoris TaxID=315423 RepID=A0A1Y5RGT4_9RHOB|nr:hypothetical protein SAMN04488020_101426 [Palleronia marisminoris]SLN16847.1 topology modulation protein [Palleronia marisminoris]
MKRKMIVGQPRAGKSTLARELGARTGLPVVHIDGDAPAGSAGRGGVSGHLARAGLNGGETRSSRPSRLIR